MTPELLFQYILAVGAGIIGVLLAAFIITAIVVIAFDIDLTGGNSNG